MESTAKRRVARFGGGVLLTAIVTGGAQFLLQDWGIVDADAYAIVVGLGVAMPLLLAGAYPALTRIERARTRALLTVAESGIGIAVGSASSRCYGWSTSRRCSASVAAPQRRIWAGLWLVHSFSAGKPSARSRTSFSRCSRRRRGRRGRGVPASRAAARFGQPSGRPTSSDGGVPTPEPSLEAARRQFRR